MIKKVIRQSKTALIAVLKGTPKTEAMLKPEKIQDTTLPCLERGAITLEKVIESEMMAPATMAEITREIIKTV